MSPYIKALPQFNSCSYWRAPYAATLLQKSDQISVKILRAPLEASCAKLQLLLLSVFEICLDRPDELNFCREKLMGAMETELYGLEEKLEPETELEPGLLCIARFGISKAGPQASTLQIISSLC